MSKRNWIQSFSGKKVTPLDLQPEQVDIESIAHALSLKCRFTGHTKVFYSVAEHCVTGAAYLPSAFQLPFLLHEVSEAYLPDVATPVKRALWVSDGEETGPLTTWETLERRQAAVVFRALGLEALEPLIYSPQVKLMDLRMLVTEREALIGPEIEPWGIDAKPLSMMNALGMQSVEAERRFLEAFYRWSTP